ncbi:hypothetical protein [Rubrivirga marina]|uniref:DUF4412 domain-containing protein n=1 Tax=Rubrivirga marina TaxID=1196024 RepID=A0A271J4Q1_9BACT|nr:hypothetical protein [Rubrivirga marina]PAP78496.1 hypothetical protein BSZ37_19735 [Rubrivirga marina]
MRSLLTLLLLAFAVGGATAQDAPADTLVLTPGDGMLTTDWLEAGTESFTVRLVAPMRQNVGTATETLTIEDGVVTRVTEISVPMQGLAQTDSIAADAATLVPRTHNSMGGPIEVSLEFMSEGVVGMVTPPEGDATTVTLMTDAPVFDSAWAGEVAQSLPLIEGTVARMQAFTAQSPDAPIDVVYTVGAQETMDERTVWPVSTEMGPVTMTYYVEAETRELLKTQFSPQPGVTVEIAPAE